ncbi:hypothetical protein HY218_02620, partial [Candidatus Saccharibacteria bacterium]|nr:hypothetical protein [Candidatus Saccharibacteria bacterium]
MDEHSPPDLVNPEPKIHYFETPQGQAIDVLKTVQSPERQLLPRINTNVLRSGDILRLVHIDIDRVDKTYTTDLAIQSVSYNDVIFGSDQLMSPKVEGKLQGTHLPQNGSGRELAEVTVLGSSIGKHSSTLSPGSISVGNYLTVVG